MSPFHMMLIFWCCFHPQPRHWWCRVNNSSTLNTFSLNVNLGLHFWQYRALFNRHQERLKPHQISNAESATWSVFVG
jgi:hypothetical protein